MAIKKWYVLHTYSQHEEKVKASIENFASVNGLTDKIGEVFLPKKTIREIDKNGQTKEKQKIVYPGYLYVNVCLTDDIWHNINNIDGVTGFLGERPIALSRREIEEIKESVRDKKLEKISAWKVGDEVIITSGPFEDYEGKIESVTENKVTVIVEFFNKLTPVEVDFEDIENI